MRVPISWLRECVDVPLNATAESVHEALVRVGLEEEAVHTLGVTGPVVVGQVLKFTPELQSNGKTVNWCQVDVGEAEARGIVCGAHNFAVGDKVVVALPGAVLPGPFPIAARTTYGHVSDGMMASARELGLGDEHDGILLLASLGLDPDVGVDAARLLGLDDWAVEVNVTPDRGYAFSIRGIAREFSHSTGANFRDPATPVDSSAGHGFDVIIADQAPVRERAAVTVFVTRVVRDVDPTRPTPAWMVARLTLAGIRCISLVVDITNYVMLEIGQPLHGYDFDRISGGFEVRRARAGEKLKTLDGSVRTLDLQDLVITDDSGPIGLAGVMGGASTEISNRTTNVLIEAANFDPVSIARTARRHRLPSEASRRFERGVDPQIADAAAARAVQLLERFSGGSADPLGSRFCEPAQRKAIELPDGFVGSLTGADYSAEEILSSLTEIGGAIERVGDSLMVTAPSWRPDLNDKATLVEEVARIIGYDRIPALLPVAPPGRGLTREQRLRRSAAQVLAANGLVEVLSYPFVSAESNATFGQASAIKLANPLDAEAPFLRTSLIPGLIDVARRNLSRGLVDLGIYEVGTVVRPVENVHYGSAALPLGAVRPSNSELEGLLAGIPPQPLFASVLLLGAAVHKQPGAPSEQFGVADALDAARQLAAAVHATLNIRQGSHPALHPGRTAELYVGASKVGFAGELLPSLAAERDLPRIVAVLELDLALLIALARPDVEPTPISAYPAATQDLSLVVALDTPAGDVLEAVIEGAGELLEAASLVDDYRGPAVEIGRKSITLALRFRAGDRTLTAAEATASKRAGAALAAGRFGATVRE